MKKLILLAIISLLCMTSFAQNPLATPADARLVADAQKWKAQQQSLIKNLTFKNVGPTVMSGRVTALSVNPADPANFYVAYASGGVWRTVNNGNTFEPIFNYESTMTIGHIAVFRGDKEIIWVGTGEVNSSRSSYAGTGVFKSSDGGKTWENKGLTDSHHIGRIVLHPTNPNIAWVAAMGHLYSNNAERGVFKTTDGGNTWNKTLYINDSTGAVDLLIDPKNVEILYATTWERDRKAWHFKGNGSGSGIYKSTNGGESWNLLSTKESGFPVGEGVGRIGISISQQNSNVLYAFLDNQFNRKLATTAEKGELTKASIQTMTSENFLKLNNADLDFFLRKNDFPEKYTAEYVKDLLRLGKIEPKALIEYLEDANVKLFNTPVIGAEVYKSTDAGKTWKKTHTEPLEDLSYTYGYYFGEIVVSPANDQEVYVLGVPILKSENGGKDWKYIGGDNVHADHHALWINPNKKGHLINGNDGGVNISYDDGINWFKCNSEQVGQFYSVAYDMASPYNLYGGLQDNGVWVGPSNYEKSVAWHDSGQYPYKMLIGGDGMQVQVDFRDNATVYTGYQFGNYYRINNTTGDFTPIQPKHELGERPLRFNWQTPIHLSRHNQDILYFGSNKLHRSMDKGNTWQTISGDLTKGGKPGNVAFGTLTTISESPLKFGLIYVGTDDGNIQLTTDGGNTWKLISDNLPQNYWVSHVQASAHNLGTVWVSLNGYRWDNFEPLVYRSDDFGATWIKLTAGLPNEPVNVVYEDPKNERIIYIGTDNGLFISLNKGAEYFIAGKSLPAVAVHDLEVHPTANELIVGTHGRSIYTANVSVLQQLNTSTETKQIALINVKNIRHNPNWGRSWSKWFAASPEPHLFPYYATVSGKMKLTITTKTGLQIAEIITEIEKGVGFASYDLTILPGTVSKFNEQHKLEGVAPIEKSDDNKFYIPKGTYKITLSVGNITETAEFSVK